MPLRITDQITLQDWEMTESFTRASGPGGQNVNKVSSAVELRFEAERSPNLPDPVKRRLRRLAGRRWTKEGAVVIQVSEERSQARNREIARERLADLTVAPKKRRGRRVGGSRPKKREATDLLRRRNILNQPSNGGSVERRIKAKKGGGR
jgi:ribosome-associated protein